MGGDDQDACGEEDPDTVHGACEVAAHCTNDVLTKECQSYNREEAEGDARRFIDAGATLNPALGPRRNPWGSQALIKEPHLVSGFYSTNGWLACGFR